MISSPMNMNMNILPSFQPSPQPISQPISQPIPQLTPQQILYGNNAEVKNEKVDNQIYQSTQSCQTKVFKFIPSPYETEVISQPQAPLPPHSRIHRPPMQLNPPEKYSQNSLYFTPLPPIRNIGTSPEGFDSTKKKFLTKKEGDILPSISQLLTEG